MIRAAALLERVTLEGRFLPDLSESGYYWDESGAEELVDRYGNPIVQLETGVEVACAVQVIVATEEEIRRNTRIQRYRFFVAPDAPVDGLTGCTWRGRSLEVIGEPLMYTMRGREHHYEFEAREIQG